MSNLILNSKQLVVLELILKKIKFAATPGIVSEHSDRVVVIVGERKCGKTVLLRKIVEELECMDYLAPGAPMTFPPAGARWGRASTTTLGVAGCS